MRLTPAIIMDDASFRQSVERLAALPIRPTVARQLFAGLTEEPDSALLPFVAGSPSIPPVVETDLAWALARARSAAPGSLDPATVLIDHAWWQAGALSSAGLEAITRLWRHSVAVAFAARRLARDLNDPEPDRLARAGLLHHLGLWAVAAVDPDRLVAWLAADPLERSGLEQRWFGTELTAFACRLAGRWGCDPLVIDAAWLHADRDGLLNDCSAAPDRLALIQQAYDHARRTPWAVAPDPVRDFGPTATRLRVLIAEVQSRCGGAFVDPEATPREEWLTRDNLRLRRDLARTADANRSAARLVASLAESSPLDGPQSWADRAALAWCGEPGVAAARVAWRHDDRAGPADEDQPPPRPPTASIPLGDPAQPAADLLVWDDPTARAAFSPPTATLAGWNGWARVVADRARLARLLDRAVGAHRRQVTAEETGRRRSASAALAEFAAGAGHEINNPLAVIMGRAQLLLARSADAETTRSLRAIISQAQRAHRILRDLMFVARPGEARPRACQPDEIVRASLRDLQHEAEAHGVSLVLDAREASAKVWADPEPLRQVADILTRNALEASPTGATVRFATGGDARNLRWVVHDSGRGISPAEGEHLFDPFYCGRAAGRGLGLGLPRAARIVDGAGGEIRWQSTPGQGATFQVTMPIEEIPEPGPPVRVEPAT